MTDKPGQKPEAEAVPFVRGAYDGDVAHFTKEIARDPANAAAYESRGFAHYLNDDYDLAIVDYSQALRLHLLGPDRTAWRFCASAGIVISPLRRSIARQQISRKRCVWTRRTRRRKRGCRLCSIEGDGRSALKITSS
jgi:hypothetical protein